MVWFQLLFYPLRHFAFASLLAVAGVTFWSLLYFGLLLFAVATGGGVGGPLAYPFGLVLVACGIGVALFLFFPACALAQGIIALTGWPRIVGLPLALLLMVAVLGVERVVLLPGAISDALPAVLPWLLVMQALYWCLTDGPVALFDFCWRWMKKRRMA